MKKKIQLLTKKELQRAVDVFEHWKLDSKRVKFSRTFEFEKHIDALIFIARTTVNAEILKHHPDITFTYCKVKVSVTSHEQKGLTQKDVELLARIDRVFAGQQVDKK